MCGICGITWRDEKLIDRMTDSMSHRGPDQRGTWTGNHASLGHRRLSIIDLSDHGRQPMFNEDKSVCLVFNGEIYNFRELRDTLLKKGHVFASNTDSEVILHAYEEYGPDVVSHLQGMFAFGLWNIRTNQLMVARDRIGIKPLYYSLSNGKLRFASEIKSILEDPEVSRELNRQALFDYIGFEFVPAPETMFNAVYKLPAGHLLLFHDGVIEIRQYWNLTLGNGDEPMSYQAAVERERELLDQAVQSHLVSDVPLGVFLSGGLDSSALVAMMRRHITGRLQTFTIGYRDKTFSELDYAKQVADVFDTDHQVLMIDDMKPDYVEQALWHLDEPMTDLSAVPLFLLCREAKKHVTVCLSGEGGDESFAGYDRFKASRLNRCYSMLPRLLRHRAIAPAIMALPDQPQKKGAINMLKRFIEGSLLPEEGAHLRWQYFSNTDQDRRLFQPAFMNSVLADRFRLLRFQAEKCSSTDHVNREIYLDMRFMMTDSVLMKVDKMSMASAVEIRVPLLDHVLVEFIASLPGNWKLKGLRTKRVFRSALEGILPDRIVNRGKQGYSLPVKHLLREGMKDYMVSLLNESILVRQCMNTAHIDRLIAEHCSFTHNHNHVLWALMNTAIWAQRFNVT